MLRRLTTELPWSVKLGAVALGIGLASGPAGAEELRIGFLAPMTGIFAQVGKDMSNGFEMYLDEVGNDFAGAKVKFILEDGQGKPPVNVRKAEKLIRQDKVHMFIGGLLASTGYALAPVSTKLKTVYIPSVAAADDLTQRQASKYPFLIRTGWTSSQPSHPFGEWACGQRAFLARFSPILPALAEHAVEDLDPEQCFMVRTLLIHEYRRVILRDPLLPNELLPGEWPGSSARKLCRDLYRVTQQLTEQHLMATLQTPDGPLPQAASYFYARFGGLT